MTVHVAVVDPLPVFRRGVATAVSALGHLVEEPQDIEAWARARPGGMVLLTLDSAADVDRVAALCRMRPRPLVVALPSSDVSSLGVRALQAGARSVVARAATVPALQRAVSATLDGEAVMPVGVADLLLTGRPARLPRRPAPTAQQVAWLLELSRGRTVASLAAEAGYSERAMYRLLQALYQQIGVSTRLEAIMLGREAGWFDG
ncbi:DNA-binding response regulator [Dactylosporangium sp. AC04546]|uniref:DNA-binding response regulator n=1 Tax=Dactylosporangium sp. AC04546 TaxID=2862460 RepID=UPI001EDE1A63|nr:DNA-binding response regulator [Dactylosporangium sp. AC04546]WVK80473.1 DNA-binding response regulator [Dactylosporangium sp. AC04546]